eukprot:TRINITY_DN32151_c0_g1_i1.p1 TRINITY_DN32151_c0_g1~~TRINITY_DN32151_c0_g1_i1.p1  ORF type:complete len:142 (-),score=23.68 TRINITY_DN32151_c0_g1_i1:257-682(-)
MRQRSVGTFESSTPLGLVAIAAGLLAFCVSAVVYCMGPHDRRQQFRKTSPADPETGERAVLMLDAEGKDLSSMAQATAVAVAVPRLVYLESGAATPCFGSRAMPTPCSAPCTSTPSWAQKSNQDVVLSRHEFAAFMASARP